MQIPHPPLYSFKASWDWRRNVVLVGLVPDSFKASWDWRRNVVLVGLVPESYLELDTMMIEQKSILVHSVGGFTEVWTTVTIKKMKIRVKGLEEEEMGKKKEVHVFHVQTIQAECEVKEEDGPLTHKNLQWEKKEEDVAETAICQEDASA